jgi:phosphoribosyl-AMP cyclohydrolase
MSEQTTDWTDEIKWDENGLVPVIAQEVGSGDILMFAWMNREALRLSKANDVATYWSRSRQRLWRKGEESGNQQIIHSIRLDCDKDVILLRVEQKGGVACHTGRHSCFYRQLYDQQWETVEPVLKDPKEMYRQ